MSDQARIAEILRCAGILLPNDYTRSWDYNRALNELAAQIDAALHPRPPGRADPGGPRLAPQTGNEMSTPERLFHGGAPGLRVGDLITPRTPGDEQHLVDGCPTCEARRRGEPLDNDDNDAAMVYVTTDREYARIYAAGYPRGGLYRVEPIGELVDRSAHDPAPSWGCEAARVTAVIDPLVTLTTKWIRSLMRRWMQ